MNEPDDDRSWAPPQPEAVLIRSDLSDLVRGPVSTLFEDLYLTVAAQETWARSLVRRHPFLEPELAVPPWSFLAYPTVNGFVYERLGVPRRPLGVQTKHGPRRLRSTVAAVKSRIVLFLNATFRWRNLSLPNYLGVVDSWRQRLVGECTDDDLLAGICMLARANASYLFHGVAHTFSRSHDLEQSIDGSLAKSAPEGLANRSTTLLHTESSILAARAALWNIAEQIGSSKSLVEKLSETQPEELLSTIRADSGPIYSLVTDYLTTHGHLMSSLDFCEPLPIDDPVPTMAALQSMVTRPESDPDRRMNLLSKQAEESVQEVSAALTLFGRRRFSRLIRKARKARAVREEALSHLGEAWPVLRNLAIELGDRMRKSGALPRTDLVFELKICEIDDWIAARETKRAVPKLGSLAVERDNLRLRRRSLSPPQRIEYDTSADSGEL